MFKITKNRYNKIYNILGIKIKIIDKKLMLNTIKSMELEIERLTKGKYFSWSNMEKMGPKEKLWFIRNNFYRKLGYFPNLNNPRSFNEKINWLKLNYYNPVESQCIDKYEFKNYIKNVLGDGFTVPLIGVYNDVDEIDFDKLPDKFVIKTTTNGSASGVQIVKDKNNLNIDALKFKFNNLLQEWNKVYYVALCKGYENIKPRIIIEEFIEEIALTDSDYKIFCFNGKAKLFYIANNFAMNKSHESQKVSYYDIHGERLPIIYDGYGQNNIQKLEINERVKEMLKISETIAKDFPFVRVDFFNTKEKLYLAELTFTPGGGFGKYEPLEWDYKIGELLDLSQIYTK